jgi:hypothetical protein
MGIFFRPPVPGPAREGNDPVNMREKGGRAPVDPKVMEEIVGAIADVDYGEVLIMIHNSKVVQIEKKIKKRFKE